MDLLLTDRPLGCYESVILTELATATDKSNVHANRHLFCQHPVFRASIRLVSGNFAFVVSPSRATRRRCPSKPRLLQKTPEFADFTTPPATSRCPVSDPKSDTLRGFCAPRFSHFFQRPSVASPRNCPVLHSQIYKRPGIYKLGRLIRPTCEPNRRNVRERKALASDSATAGVARSV